MKRRQPSGGKPAREPRPRRAPSSARPEERAPRSPRQAPRRTRDREAPPAVEEPRPRREYREPLESREFRPPRMPRQPRQLREDRPPRAAAPRQPRDDRPPRAVAPRQREAVAGPRDGQGRRDDVIYGRNAVVEAARAGRVKRVLIAEGLDPDPRLEELRGLVPVQEVAPARIAALAQGAHQGVVAELQPRTYLTLKQLLDASPDLIVALDGIEDPQNLGAILRSAEAAGAGGIVLPERRSAPLSAVAVKASSGASEHLRLARVAGLPSAISEIRRAGIWCVALDPHGDLMPWDFDLTEPVCVVVGGEGHGVHRLVRERCDARVRLPMSGRVASLNASAAAAALLYEVSRQRSI